VFIDINVPIDVGARAGAPEHCGKKVAWIPQVGRMDAACGPGFQAFETYDTHNNAIVIDSLKKLRDVERESEVAARNGEGQPLVWRRYSNDDSNRDVHTLAPGWTGGERPDPAYVKKHAAAIRRTASEPDVAYGPGVNDESPCALDALTK
jgi:hypothetical protein